MANNKLGISIAFILALMFQQVVKAEALENTSEIFKVQVSEVGASETKPRVGDGTQAWLELQRSGSQASTHKQTLSGPVMEKVYNRYKESFSQPIPKVTEQNARKTN